MSETNSNIHKEVFEELFKDCDEMCSKLRERGCANSVLHLWKGFSVGIRECGEQRPEEYLKLNKMMFSMYLDLVKALLE